MINPHEINLESLSQFKENNRLEAKLAKDGLPNSIWETYSSFANTQGGLIVLGIREKKDSTFEVSGIDHPERMISDFWNTINNRKKISENILTDSNVFVNEIDGKNVIFIHVPRADRTSKPVYIGTDFFSGSFRRNGEGDYHCNREDVLAMVRDNAIQTQDAKLLTDFEMDVFNKETVAHYKNRFLAAHPHHVWENLAQDEFLVKLGAAARNKEDGKFYPTAAGLLMFGDEYNIVREFGNYFLDYREEYDPATRWSDRIISSSGDWSGNLFDFFFNVCGKLVSNIKAPFSLNGMVRVDDTPVHAALREALANALIHADYYGRRGIVIVKKPEYISISNPGTFRVSPEEAISGGLSDPRNGTIIKMFNLINIGERAGSGLPWIYSAWSEDALKKPELSETFDPDRIEIRFEVKSEISLKKDDDPQSDDFDPQNAIDDPQNDDFDPQKTIDDLQSDNFDPQSDPQNIADDPQSDDFDPQNTIDDPQSDPQNIVDDPQNIADDPQSDDFDPQNAIDDPQNDDFDPQSDDFDPQNTIDDPQSDPQNIVDDPQNIVDDPQKNREIQILNFIKDNPKITREEIAKNLNVSIATIRRELAKMKDKVFYDGSSKNGQWKILEQ